MLLVFGWFNNFEIEFFNLLPKMDRYWTGNGPRVFRGVGGEDLTGIEGAEDEVAEASAEWTKNHKPLVMVEYQGAYKVCTEQTMRTFDLKFKRNVLPHND